MIIVFPVAGRGSRFYPESANLPKCLIPVRGKLMIEWALDTIFHEGVNILVIYHKEQLPLIKVALKCILPQAILFEQKTQLLGPADSVYQAREHFVHEKDVVIVDSDIYANSTYRHEGWQNFDGDGSVLTFTSQDSSKSYVRLEDGYVVEAAEKKVISDQAIGGIYHFRDSKAFVAAIEEEIKKEQACKGEFYLSGALQIYLKKHPKIIAYKAASFYDFGMPEGVKNFEQLAEEVIYE